MMKYELDKYVAERLSPDLQTIYSLADRVMITERDTLSDDFQLACEILDLFTKRAGQKET